MFFKTLCNFLYFFNQFPFNRGVNRFHNFEKFSSLWYLSLLSILDILVVSLTLNLDADYVPALSDTNSPEYNELNDNAIAEVSG